MCVTTATRPTLWFCPMKDVFLEPLVLHLKLLVVPHSSVCRVPSPLMRIPTMWYVPYFLLCAQSCALQTCYSIQDKYRLLRLRFGRVITSDTR